MLTLCMDQDIIGVAFTYYAINSLRCRILPLWDPSHRMWNDVRGALSLSGVWQYTLVHTVLLNVFFGPWNGSAWWEQTVEASRLFFKTAGPSYPLFSRNSSQA